MWGSLRSSSGSTSGDVQNRNPSASGGESSPAPSSSHQQSSIFGSTSFTRPRTSISSLLSSSLLSGGGGSGNTTLNPTVEDVALDELNREAIIHIDTFFGKPGYC